MTKLQLENYFTTSLMNVVDDSILGEIEFQLSVAPQSDFGYLIIDYIDVAQREEIFYHRKAGNSVFTYGVNRTNPKTHDIGASVQINDSASIFNYLTNLVPDHFFMYKTSETTCFIKGGNIYDNGEYTEIPDRSDLSFGVGTNYIYVEGGIIKSTITTPTDKLIVGQVVVDGAGNITDLVNNNVLATITQRSNTILRGSGNPGGGTGIDGDFYINDTEKLMFGPKTDGEWGSGFSIQGEPGIQGTPGVKGDKGDPGSIVEAPEGTEQDVDTYIPPAPSTVVTYNDTEKWIKITYTDGAYDEYTETGYGSTDKDGKLIYGVVDTGVYANGLITYSSFNINKTNGNIHILGKPAYKEAPNIFTKQNTFEGLTTLKGNVHFPISSDYGVNGTTIDCSLGSKQYVSWTQSNTLNLDNISQGSTMLLCIHNNHTAAIDLTIGTLTGVDAAQTFSPYQIGTIPTSLEVGLHMFVIETFNSGTHISYAGLSTPIT